MRGGIPQCREVFLQSHPDGREVRAADLPSAADLELYSEIACEMVALHVTEDLPGGGVMAAHSGSQPDLAVVAKGVRRVRRNTRRQLSDDRLPEVAEVYRASPGRPTAAVAERFSIALRTASLYVKRARDAGLLEEAKHASVKKRPDGRWRARYRDAAGKEHARHFARKVDGQRWLDAVTASVLAGTYVSPATARTTVAQWCGTWLAGYATRRASTVREARTHVRQITAEFGDMPLAAVRPSHVKAWRARLRAGGLSASYVYALHSRLAQIMGDAVHDGSCPGRRARAGPHPAPGNSVPTWRPRCRCGRCMTRCPNTCGPPFCWRRSPGCGWPSRAGCVWRMWTSCAV